MIDLDNFTSSTESEALKAFMAAVHRGLMVERRLSTVVRATLNGERLDFKITYMGPSRLRRKARRPSMADSSKGSKQS